MAAPEAAPEADGISLVPQDGVDGSGGVGGFAAPPMAKPLPGEHGAEDGAGSAEEGVAPEEGVAAGGGSAAEDSAAQVVDNGGEADGGAPAPSLTLTSTLYPRPFLSSLRIIGPW